MACLVAAMVGSSLVWLITGSWTPMGGLLWLGRNYVGLVGIVVLGLLILPSLEGREKRAPRDRRLEHGRLRIAEATVLFLATGLLYGLVFVTFSGQPLVFLLLAPTVWAGIRLPPTAVVLHGLLGGVLAVVFTLNEVGPFITIESVSQRALVAQIFVLMSVVTGLALAFSRSERDVALAGLRAAQAETVARARLLDSVLETMHEGVAVVDADDNVLVRNRAGRRLMGLDDAPGLRVRPPEEAGLFHLDGQLVKRHELPHRRVLDGDTVEAEDFVVRSELTPQGRVIEVSAQPLERPSDHEPQRVLVHFRDVTADRKDRDALASFAGVVAHDLLSPLTVVEGWSEALVDDLESGSVDAESGLPKVERIQRAAEHMRTFIKELLSWTVARGQVLSIDSVDLSALARSVAEMRSDTETRPRITVVEGLRVWGDEVLLRQLLDNLIGNAVKYVAPGVRPEIEVTGRHDAEELEVRVSDNGIGIPSDQREQIFDTFHRAHVQGYRGTGLGLSICRQIVERHGGRIRVEAAPGGGSTFVISLPTGTLPTTEPSSVHPEAADTEVSAHA
ncbi:MAG: ATP-binding protein [Marmoricola sp.]